METKKLVRTIDSSIMKTNLTTWTRAATTKKYYTNKFKRKTITESNNDKVKEKEGDQNRW